MAGGTMPRDSTIASVYARGRLINAEDYVRNVIGRMSPCRSKGSVAVRIGIKGEGKAPNYRVEFGPAPAAPFKVDAAYNGQNHRKLAEEDVLDEVNWSTETMTFADVQALLERICEISGRP